MRSNHVEPLGRVPWDVNSCGMFVCLGVLLKRGVRAGGPFRFRRSSRDADPTLIVMFTVMVCLQRIRKSRTVSPLANLYSVMPSTDVTRYHAGGQWRRRGGSWGLLCGRLCPRRHRDEQRRAQQDTKSRDISCAHLTSPTNCKRQRNPTITAETPRPQRNPWEQLLACSALRMRAPASAGR